jgi:hypothetical protein
VPERAYQSSSSPATTQEASAAPDSYLAAPPCTATAAVSARACHAATSPARRQAGPAVTLVVPSMSATCWPDGPGSAQASTIRARSPRLPGSFAHAERARVTVALRLGCLQAGWIWLRDDRWL